DLVLLTSHTEGLPLSLLEAMAMGVPVVATRVGGIEELVTHGQDGLVADAGDIGRMASHVIKLKQDSVFASTLGKDARAKVEKDFSLEDNVRRLEDIYRRLCPS
ncbi:MAG: glycosyltransferase family 4 protein, partial [Deltaproteobacteria bacterium]|nr:glycosyltransferase family 4 protein [Deltaproteobacteria bacterium]